MFLYILLALVVLLVMITVHEFGHYCAGKILGFKINEFAIGFGLPLFKKTNKKTGEVFSIRCLPLGGYCAFEGEDDAGNESPDSFNKMPGWKRLIVLVSGVAFNFLFGVITAVIFLLVNGYATPKVSATVYNQTATEKQLRSNDIILAVDGKKIEAYRSYNDMIAKYKAGEEITLTVSRDGKIIDVTTAKKEYGAFYYIADFSKFDGKVFDIDGNKITELEFENAVIEIKTNGETEDEKGKGSAILEYFGGIYKSAGENKVAYTKDDIAEFLKNGAIGYVKNATNYGMVFSYETQKYNFGECLLKAWPFCFYLCGTIFTALGGLFTGATKVSDMGGTITAISQIAQISSWGTSYFLLLLPLLAMNLALFNILPIPALDGAKCVFVIIEMIFRKPVNRKVEGWIHTIGLILLLGLVIFLDIYHFAFASHFILRL